MGSSGIVVDTDILIDYLKKRQPGAELLKKAYLKHRIHVTSTNEFISKKIVCVAHFTAER